MANIVYEKLKAVVEANSLTDVQIELMTKAEALLQAEIEDASISDEIFDVAKARLLREYERMKWQNALEGLKTQLIGGARVWLQNNFPDAEFFVDHHRKAVTIFFEGKPAEDEL